MHSFFRKLLISKKIHDDSLCRDQNPPPRWPCTGVHPWPWPWVCTPTHPKTIEPNRPNPSMCTHLQDE